ncbi:MAG: alpha/beta fold hydrolase [Sphaerochaetaceae bacterium]|nr:alpha/beta fold hydrolase [Sphaerochaetaceae bacterium]
MEQDIVIGEHTPYPLEGILSLPQDLSVPVPAVILVHGSGPTDKDETIFRNRPFYDISEGLTARGIAVLRYDKRTKIYGKAMKKAPVETQTVKTETIDDAVLASELLKADDRIDSNRVFIFGHSLGGMLAPCIDAEGGDFAGIIIAAGSPRTLSDVMMSQNEAIIDQLPRLLQILARKQMAKLRKTFLDIEEMSEAEAKAKKVMGGISAWYFKEMAAHPVKEYLQSLKKPVLILQGQKDAQVSLEQDFLQFQQLYSDKETVSFKEYPDLNHLFMKSVYGTLKDIRKEYRIARKVEPEVIEDIAQWILTH